MATFSAVDAGISGFKLAFGRPRVLLIWGVLMLAVSLVASVGMIVTMGPWLAELQAASGETADPSATLGLLAKIAPFYGLLLIGGLIYYGVVLSGVSRMVLRPEDQGFAFLAFGGDELRMIGVLVVQGLALAVVYTLLVTVVAIGIALASMAGAAIGILVGVILVPAAFAALIFLLVRFSLAGAQTFATKSINILGTWALSRGRFWPMLGAYALAFVILIAAWLVMMAVQTAISLAVGGGVSGLAGIFQPDMSSLAAYFTPAMIVYVVLAGFFSALTTLITYAPAAVIYRDIAQPKTADVFA